MVVDPEADALGPVVAEQRRRTADEHDAAVFDEHLVHEGERNGQRTVDDDPVDLIEVHRRTGALVERVHGAQPAKQ